MLIHFTMINGIPPAGGVCGTVLANGSLSSNTSNEGTISLWILRKGKGAYSKGKVLFMDARKLGHMADRKVWELSEEERVNKYGDVLVSNICPHFKKIWKAEFDGGCSNDVLVFESNENEPSPPT